MKAIQNIKNIVIILLIILLVFLLFFFISRLKTEEGPRSVMVGPESMAEQVFLAKEKLSLEKEDRIIGDRKAPLQVFVYEDVSNVYSAELASTLERLHNDYKKELVIIVRPFISRASLISRDAALLVECAADQNKWLEMRTLLLSMVKNESLDLNNFTEYGQQIGLEDNAFQVCLTSQEKYAKIDELADRASSYDILGAPTMFIGEEMIIGARPYDDYKDSSGDSVDGLKTIIGKRLKK
jgi:protein-disulfide isomerase